MSKDGQKTEKRVAGSWERKITATEIVEERAKSNINQEQARNFLWGDKADYAQMEERWKEQVNDPIMANNHKFYEMTTKEKKVY